VCRTGTKRPPEACSAKREGGELALFGESKQKGAEREREGKKKDDDEPR